MHVVTPPEVETTQGRENYVRLPPKLKAKLNRIVTECSKEDLDALDEHLDTLIAKLDVQVSIEKLQKLGYVVMKQR